MSNILQYPSLSTITAMCELLLGGINGGIPHNFAIGLFMAELHRYYSPISLTDGIIGSAVKEEVDMTMLAESTLRKLIESGETSTVELNGSADWQMLKVDLSFSAFVFWY